MFYSDFYRVRVWLRENKAETFLRGITLQDHSWNYKKTLRKQNVRSFKNLLSPMPNIHAKSKEVKKSKTKK